MIDDDYRPGEGDQMPPPYWRICDLVTVVTRDRTSRIPTAPLVALGHEFWAGSNRYGPLYVALSRHTRFNAYDPHRSPARRTYDTLVGAHPDTFTTVIDASATVWLALRLTRLTDAVADTILAAIGDATPAQP